MLQRTIINKTQQCSYRNYLQFNANSHPDGFISPRDWINIWNMHKWELMTEPSQRSQSTPYILPCLSSNQEVR
jgi:hypothetical protein